MLSDVRIPISLKVAQDDFYYDFVLPKKDTKELSTFIHDLMKVYYETEEVRLVVDKYLVSGDKISVIRRDLDAIIKEQLANQMETDALVERFESEKERIVSGMYDAPETYHATKESEKQAQLLISSSENSSEQGNSKTPGASANPNLEERTKQLEEKFDNFSNKFDKLFEMLSTGNPAAFAVSQSAHAVQESVVSAPVVSAPVVEEKKVAEPSFVPEVSAPVEENNIAIPPVNKDASNVVLGQPVIMNAPIIEEGPAPESSEPTTSKPAAFSKMMRSMK